MKNQGSGPLVLSPELWVGVVIGYDQKFTEAYKAMVSVRAWDPQSKTWWMPISYMPHVKQLMREHHCASDATLDNAHALIQSELNRRVQLKRATDVDGQVSPVLVDNYAMLGLHPNASRTLIEWAILLARKEGTQLGAPTTRLLQQEEAYQQILAGGSV